MSERRIIDVLVVLAWSGIMFLVGDGVGRWRSASCTERAEVQRGDPMPDPVSQIRTEVGKIVAQRDECLAREAVTLSKVTGRVLFEQRAKRTDPWEPLKTSPGPGWKPAGRGWYAPLVPAISFTANLAAECVAAHGIGYWLETYNEKGEPVMARCMTEADRDKYLGPHGN